jgi:hypothetical protein
MALVLYTTTLAPTVLAADAGEFQFVAWLPGIAHPTGYPFYVLLGYFWTHLLPIGEVAWRMNLLSAACAALAVGVTYGVARQMIDATWPHTPAAARMMAAAVSATTFAVTHTFWSQALVAEVYALQALLVATIFWLALRFGDQAGPPSPARWSGKLLAFTFGLGLAHHVTTILLLPGLALYLWVSRPRQRRKAGSRRAIAKRLVSYGVFFAAPLLFYLYIPLVAPATPYTRLEVHRHQPLILYENSLQGFVRHVSGAVFAGQLQPTALTIDRFTLAWHLLRRQVGLVGVFLALFGLIALWRQRKIDLLLLTGVTFLTFVVFNSIYLIGDVFVLFIPAWLIVCLWLGVGCLALAKGLAQAYLRQKINLNQFVVFERLRDRLGWRAYRLVIIGLVSFFFALPLTLVTLRTAEISQRNNTTASRRWQEILSEPIPPAAILLSNDRNEIMPMWYYQFVDGRRPDLLGLFPLIVPAPDYADVGRVLDQALASGRPVYFIKSMEGLKLKVDVTPEGSLFRATAYAASPDNPLHVTLPAVTVGLPAGRTVQESIDLLGYDVTPASVMPGDEVTVTLYWQTTRDLAIDYTSFVHLISDGDSRIAQNDHQPGAVFYPSSLWQTGELLRDEHKLAIPVDVPAGIYRLRIGLYYQPAAGEISGMGDGVEIGIIPIKEPVSVFDASPSE